MAQQGVLAVEGRLLKPLGLAQLVRPGGVERIGQFRKFVPEVILARDFGAGALAMLAIMQQPFGFMAFLGVASLVGVIVSHIIVLFDFIEEAHHQRLPLETALIDAAIVRLRPVMITVCATVLGLVRDLKLIQWDREEATPADSNRSPSGCP